MYNYFFISNEIIDPIIARRRREFFTLPLEQINLHFKLKSFVKFSIKKKCA